MLTSDTIITLVNPLIVSRIDYCNAVLAGVHEVHLRQLQRVLNAAARLIVRKRKYDNISATIRDVLHWLSIRQRADFKLCVTVFNSLHNLAPNYLSTMFQLVAENPSRQHLRSAARGDLAVPATQSATVLSASPSQDRPRGTRCRHLYETVICQLPSSFRCERKAELFARAYFY